MAKSTKHCRRQRFAEDISGGVMTIVAVLLPVLLGFGAIAIDMGYWFYDRRAMQTAADSAAITAAFALADGAGSAAAITAAKATAASNGYGTSNSSLVNVAIDATSGTATATITRDADLFLSRVLLNAGDADISVNAVAGPRNSAPVCLLALQGFDSGITENGGSSDVDIWGTNCSVQANSSAATALDTNGVNAWIVAESVCANYSEPPTGNNVPNATPPAYSCPPILDPFPTQLAPEWDGTEDNCPTSMAPAPSTSGSTTTVFGGCYIDDKVQVNKDLVFETDGVFFFYNTEVNMAGGQNDTDGEDVTFFFYGDSTIDLTGSRNMNISAKPSTDPDYPNILIAGDASNVTDMTGGQSGDSKIGGSTTANIEGIIYLPKQDLRVGGTGDMVATESMIVANTVTVVGNGSLTITSPTFDSVSRSVVMLLQ